MEETLHPVGDERQDYEKPALRIIELVAEEVLANTCKGASVGAAQQLPTCQGGGCLTVGS
jgi:hypothetical protein